MTRARGRVGLVVWCIGIMFVTRGSAFVLTGQDWSYQAAPMGENWIVCGTGVPGSGVQRTKDGAAGWNYAHFSFTFGPDACSSGGLYPSFNDVNQFDVGGGLGAGVLAETTWFFFVDNSTATIECDMRFSNAFSWYTGTGSPPVDQFDWWSVAIHEMGHCLGLEHETRITNPTPVMSPSFAPGEVRRALTPDDSAGRDAIYAPAVWAIVPGGGFTPSAPAATVFQGNLGLFVRGIDDQLYVNWLLVNDQWAGWTLVPGGGTTPSAPAATAALDGEIALLVRGVDNQLYVNWLLVDNQWTGWSLVPGRGLTPSTPAATALDGDIALFARGTDDRIYMNFTLTEP